MKHRRQPDSGATGEASRDHALLADDRSRTTPGAADAEAAGRHGLHHDESIDTEHEPFSVTSQRCRGEYP